MIKLIAKINTLKNQGRNSKQVGEFLGLNHSNLEKLVKWDSSFLSEKALRIIYGRAWLRNDEELRQIVMDRNNETIKHFQPTNSILGSIFRLRRLSLGYKMEDVARIIKANERSIRRIEEWKALSSYTSYIVSQLIIAYEFTPQEAEKIRWFICIIKDMITIAKKHWLKCHWL